MERREGNINLNHQEGYIGWHQEDCNGWQRINEESRGKTRRQHQPLSKNCCWKLHSCQSLLVAENYACQYQEEVQSAHWHHNHVTIHPISTYFACSSCDGLVNESVVLISNDPTHDYHAVLEHWKKYGMSLVPRENYYLKDLFRNSRSSRKYRAISNRFCRMPILSAMATSLSPRQCNTPNEGELCLPPFQMCLLTCMRNCEFE